MHFPVLLNKFILLIAITLTFIVLVRCSEKTTSCCCKECNCKNFIILSTLDGSITALDLNSGLQCWSVVLDPEKFLSSSLSKLEVYENGRRIFLVPSLDGSVYKYDPLKKRITPLPVNVNTLISQSGYLDPLNIINGGKIKIIHGIHRLTGEIIYTCNVSGCINFKTPIPKNMLVIEEVIQIINAIDTSKAEKRWHFRVVELKVKVTSNKDVSTFTDTSNETALISHIPPKVNDFINVDVYKISLENAFAGMINKTRNEFSWIFKAPSPINDAWVVVDDLVQLLDPFDKESGFYSVDIDDGHHSALLFLGIYEEQIFIKRSRKLQQKYSDATSLMQSYIFESVRSPVCLTEDAVLEPHLESGGTGLIPHHEHNIVSDYGFYFYANLSIGENATHCILNYTYIVTQENDFTVHVWIVLTCITAGFACCVFIMWHLYIQSKEERSFASRSTISVAVSSNADSVTLSSNEEFKSRFYQDFELISVLGKGGFGVVMDARNKIDDCHYAVKRICVHEELDIVQYDKVVREVKALAKLDHRGIVRYYNAWFEYPPAGWQEKMDQVSNICDVSKSTSEESNAETGVLISKSTKSSNHKFEKLNNSKPIVLKRLNQNPLQLFNNDLFSDNVPFEESKLSAYSSSDVNDGNNSSTSSEENSDGDLSEKDKADLTKYTDDADDSDSLIQFEGDYLKPYIPERNQLAMKYSNDLGESVRKETYSDEFWKSTHVGGTNYTDSDSDSDSFIQFENDDLISTNPEKNEFIKKNSDDDSESSVESTSRKSYSDKFGESILSKNSSSSAQKSILKSAISKKHVICYKSLRGLNQSLVYSLKFEEFDKFASFIFCDKTSTKSVVDISNWKIFTSSFSVQELDFYQKWLICILCKLVSSKDFTCSVAKDNLCLILFDINEQLHENKSPVYAISTQSVITHTAQFSCDNGKVENQLPAASKKQKDTKASVNFKEETQLRDFARGYLYIQMQLCQKESLRDWLTEHSDFRDYNKVLEIFAQIVDAVHYVHGCGLMHRDLKPSNIYFSMEGAIKIGDFGLATSSEIKVEHGSNSQPSDIHTSDIGTELYMSPEQKRKQHYDCKTDIYSLGIILFELLVPFKTTSERCKYELKLFAGVHNFFGVESYSRKPLPSSTFPPSPALNFDFQKEKLVFVLLELRKLKFPEEFRRNFQDESRLVELLLYNDPKGRPSTSEIKQHPVVVKFMPTSSK